MTTELAQSTGPTSKPAQEQEKPRRKKRAPGPAAIFFTRLVLFWERLWPAVLPALAVPYAILIISLFGLWRLIPVWLHWTTLTLSLLVFASMLWRDCRALRFPSRRAAQARLEEDGRAEHAPLQALDDKPFEKSAAASALWRAHMEESRERARKARLAGLRSTADDRDPYALRYTAVGLLAVALVAAGGDWRHRLEIAMAPGEAQGASRLVADLWIEPPDYTRKAPIYLLRAGEDLSGLAKQVDAPQGSRLVAQVNGHGRPRLEYETETGAVPAAFKRSDQAFRAELPLDQSGLLKLRLGAREIRWPVGVLADDPPGVAFTELPAATDEAQLAFGVAIDDDYGVSSAQLQYRLDPDQERPLDAPAFDDDARAEVRAADLDGVAGAPGERKVTLDLQKDPWAGLSVLAKVVVTDGAGQKGETKEVSVILPERKFFNPLAKSVIEQRQTLAVAAKDWKRVGRSFDAVTLAPEAFYEEDPTDYLLLRAAFWRVMRQGGEGYQDAVEKFWPLALQLEDQALELARQRLEAAEEALRQALESGASDDEIARLTEELRQAMNDYLTALAQSGQRADPSRAQNAQELDKSDLDQMLDAIRDLAQSGAGNAARQMLSDLENMLNNLRLAQGGKGGGSGMPGQSGQGDQSAAGQAGELIGRQRELADDSFERGQSGEGNGDDLSKKEGGLGGDLDELIDKLQADGKADPNGEATRSLSQARNDMREAEQALANDDFDAAGSAMERAIDNLRDGAKELAREEMRQARNARQGREGENGAPLDPLGRPMGRALGDGVDIPEESAAGRTRAVIEELRRRLGEPGRSKEEIDYLERLLERF